MIKRFEDEYPETRVTDASHSASPVASSTLSPITSYTVSSEKNLVKKTGQPAVETSVPEPAAASDDETDPSLEPPILLRHNSDVSLASKALGLEEGRMHRFGQKVRRDILAPEDDQMLAGQASDDTAVLDEHPLANGDLHHKSKEVKYLRAMLDGIDGKDLKRCLDAWGEDRLYHELSDEASDLRRQLLHSQEQGVLDSFIESQINAAAAARRVGNGDAVLAGPRS